MHHEVLNCLSRLLVRRLASAALQVITKRALLSFYRRRLWRALQPQHARPLSLTDSEVRALQQRTNNLSRQFAEEQGNYNQCLAAVAWWNQVTSGITLGN